MKVTADTNILIRMALKDDAVQAEAADRLLTQADLVAVPVLALCEFVWVLSRGYKLSRPKIARAIRTLIDAENVITDRRAVEAGLSLLDAGGDFADGIIAFEGAVLGGETFVSFDKDAVSLLNRHRINARLIA